MALELGNRDAVDTTGPEAGSAAGKRPLTGVLQRKAAATATASAPAPADASTRAAVDHDAPFGLHLEGQVSTATATAALNDARASHLGADGTEGDRQFRVPTGGDIKSMLSAKTIPEDKLIASIETALTRMAKEKRLKVTDPVPDLIKRIFPSPGVFDEVEFAKVVDTGDRSKIYQSVTDAQTSLNSTDKPKIESLMDDAVKLVEDAAADTTGLTEVFGTKAGTAKAVYEAVKVSLQSKKLSIDATLNTDYNRDDEEIGLGGWANFARGQVHLQRKIAEVADKNTSTTTLIHEFAHLSDATVKDKGYYGSPGFEGMSEDDKVTNAAHFEELPRRKLGTSKFVGVTFTPGKTKTGGTLTFEDEVKRAVSEYFRKAWDKAVDCHLFLRRIRAELDTGNTSTFTSKQTRILEISRLQHLTIHEQSPPTTINMNDIVLCEGVARATSLIKRDAGKQTYPTVADSGKVAADYVPAIAQAAIKTYGALTGNDTDDVTLMDWLVAEYKKAL